MSKDYTSCITSRWRVGMPLVEIKNGRGEVVERGNWGYRGRGKRVGGVKRSGIQLCM